MPPEHNQVRLEKAGAQFSTLQLSRCGVTLIPAAPHREICLALDKSLPMTVVSLTYLQGSPQLLAAALGNPPAGMGREVSSRLPVSPCAGRGNTLPSRQRGHHPFGRMELLDGEGGKMLFPE